MLDELDKLINFISEKYLELTNKWEKNEKFGIRIICNDELSFGKILELVDSKYKDLKCIDSSKHEYKATHIYFKKDNFAFQWELQVWNKIDEINNINSHEKYKQDYVK